MKICKGRFTAAQVFIVCKLCNYLFYPRSQGCFTLCGFARDFCKHPESVQPYFYTPYSLIHNRGTVTPRDNFTVSAWCTHVQKSGSGASPSSVAAKFSAKILKLNSCTETWIHQVFCVFDYAVLSLMNTSVSLSFVGVLCTALQVSAVQCNS